jgi:AcrR family transcriptional regulator
MTQTSYHSFGQPCPKQDQPAQPAQARLRYLPIATRHFARDGYHGTSLAALAKDAQVSKQALLHHFGTKHRLHAEVLWQLGDRLATQLDTAYDPDPARHFAAFFYGFTDHSLSAPDDARLVMRTFMDSDAQARIWPLKPYVDRLSKLALGCPHWQGCDPMQATSGVLQMIATVQYLAIAAPTLSGMYGAQAHAQLDARSRNDLNLWIKEVTGVGRETV